MNSYAVYPTAPSRWGPIEAILAFVDYVERRKLHGDLTQAAHDFGMLHGLGGPWRYWQDAIRYEDDEVAP